jgi:hypothetical protein
MDLPEHRSTEAPAHLQINLSGPELARSSPSRPVAAAKWFAQMLAGLVLLLCIIGAGWFIGRRAGWPTGETLCLTLGAWILVGVWVRPAIFWEHWKITWARDAFGDRGAALFYSACAGALILAGIVFRKHLQF